MTLASRLKIFMVVLFAIVSALFTTIFMSLYYHHEIRKCEAWIGQRLSDLTSDNAEVSTSSLQASTEFESDLSPGTGIQYVDSNKHVVKDLVSIHFPQDMLNQFQHFMETAKSTSTVRNEDHGPLINWYPVYAYRDRTGGLHKILAAEAPIDFPDGSAGLVQVFTVLDTVDAQMNWSFKIFVLADIVMILLFTVGTHFFVNRGLKSLKSLIDGIRSVEWAESTRLAIEGAPREIQSVVNSVNQFLQQVDKGIQDQGRFIADASHELRTPLAIIAGHANILRRWGNTKKEVWEPAVHHIVSEADRLQSLIDRLLILSRLESGYQPVPERLVSTDIRDLMLQLRDDARVLRPDLSIKALIHLGSHVEGFISKDDLRQILVILVDNAMKHTPAGGHVDIMATWDDSSIRFSVADTGDGIPKEALPHIFDRFYRVEESRTRALGGSGLGLSICKELAQAYGGKVSIRSKVWSGTTVTVILPRSV